MSVLTLEAKLERLENSTPWGFRMQGGKDFNSPLTIQKVNPGSLASKCGLQVGDIILKIGSQTTDLLRHTEAQTSIIESGNHLDLLLQRGGPNSYPQFNAPLVAPWNSQPQTYNNSPATPAHQNYNSAPRPFGSQTPSTNLSNQIKDLSLSNTNGGMENGSSKGWEYQNAAEKYSERDEAPDPSKHQSKSFKYLQNLMDEGKELNSALKPRSKPQSFTPKAYPVTQATPQPPAATPVGPGSKPGTVKAIVSQKYNTPIGLYSSETASNQFEGQSKLLMDSDTSGDFNPDDLPPPPPPLQLNETGDATETRKYFPSETLRLVEEEQGQREKGFEPQPAHSRTFKILQQQLGSNNPAAPPPPPVIKSAPTPAPITPVAKPWASPAQANTPVAKPWNGPAQVNTPATKSWNPPAPAVSNTTPKPFGSTAPPKPTGQGAVRGKKGDAAMNTPVVGRIPVCSTCNEPIRGPFVTALGKCWCPDHFTCANPQCGCKLLDIGFVEEGGFLYCEKDYAVHFAPHCEKCGRAVIGECVNTLNKSYHPECFLCSGCNKPIGGNKYHIEDGKLYCETDWNALFQTMCSACDFPIEPGDKWVEALSKNFHSECFNCSACQVNLEGQAFCAKAGKPYCKKHAR